MTQQNFLGKHATTISRNTHTGQTIITYHYTDIVSFDSETVSLNSGGWLTSTTKQRMNQASDEFRLGFKIFQKDFEWFVTYRDKTLRFYDGMVLNR